MFIQKTPQRRCYFKDEHVIEAIIKECNIPWLLMGDYNHILFP